MKQLFFAAILVLVLSACSDSAAEIRSKCTVILNDPDLTEFYQKEYVDGWREDVKSCQGDPECLTICYDMLVKKLSVAQEQLPGVRSRTE